MKKCLIFFVLIALFCAVQIVSAEDIETRLAGRDYKLWLLVSDIDITLKEDSKYTLPTDGDQGLLLKLDHSFAFCSFFLRGDVITWEEANSGLWNVENGYLNLWLIETGEYIKPEFQFNGPLLYIRMFMGEYTLREVRGECINIKKKEITR